MAQVDGSPDPQPGAADSPDVAAESSESASDDAGAGVELRGRAVRGFAWAAISFGGNKLLVFASTLVLTRLLAPSDFGVVAAGLTFIAYLEVALDLGVGSAIVYQQEKGHTRGVHVAFTMNVLACAALAALNFALAPAVAEFFRVPDAADVFRAFSIYILLRGLGALQDSLLRRDLLFREKAAADLTRALVRGGFGVVLALAGLGVWSLVWAFLVAEAAGTGVAWFKTRYRPRLMFDRMAAGPLLRFGAPVVALNLLSELGTNSDYLVVGHVLGATALGIYTIAYRLPELLLSNVYWIFSSVAFPVFSQARSDSWGLFRDSMLRALRLITLFGFPVSVGLALVSRDAVTVLFSDKWAPAGGPMALISLAIGLAAVGYGSGDIYKAAGRPGMLLVINTVGAVVLLPCFVLAAPHGLVAVAAVHLSYNAVYGMVRLAFANRLVGTTMADVLVALRPALSLSAGIVLVALPVRLLMAPGALALGAITVAGLAGAGLGLLLGGRSALDDLRGLAGELGGRRSSQPG
ncbi:MAG: hypothetical protein QOG60_2488 [Frankiaceae bacterium]|nr:hypothetical protein [Frankiaceae bacterium]